MNESLDSKNSNFWTELCGTGLAINLGISDFSELSLKKFDDYYLNYYPFLKKYLHLSQVENKDVLEIGLGYGTVSSLLIKAKAKYIGLDIAEGPVGVVNLRTSYLPDNLAAKAQQGSALDNSFPDASLDYVIAIGSLHHTGDLKRAIAECHRVLRPGGKLCFMVYYSYSYRRLFTHV